MPRSGQSSPCVFPVNPALYGAVDQTRLSSGSRLAATNSGRAASTGCDPMRLCQNTGMSTPLAPDTSAPEPAAKSVRAGRCPTTSALRDKARASVCRNRHSPQSQWPKSVSLCRQQPPRACDHFTATHDRCLDNFVPCVPPRRRDCSLIADKLLEIRSQHPYLTSVLISKRATTRMRSPMRRSWSSSMQMTRDLSSSTAPALLRA
jgi:hypothetical protein